MTIKRGILAALFLAAPVFCAAMDLGNRLFNDYSGIINTADRAMMNKMLDEYRAKTGTEMRVLVINRVSEHSDNTEVTSFAKDVFVKNLSHTKNSVLVVVAVKDRRMYIELGRSFESEYGAGLREKMTKKMVVFFREGNYAKGIYEGVRSVMFENNGQAGIKQLLLKNRKTAAVLGLILIIIISFMAAVSGKKTGKKNRKNAPIDLSFGGGAEGQW